MEQLNPSVIISLIGGVTILTNIIVEVIKKVTWDKIPTNFLALLIAEALTLAIGAAYAQINAIPVLWYHVVAAVVVGFMVALSSMIGFDKFMTIIKGWRHE